MHKSTVKFIVILALSAALSGCGVFKSEKPYTPNEAEQKLIAFCQKEGRIEIRTRYINKTLWIFLSLTEPLFDIKPAPQTGKTQRKVMPYSLLSLEGAYTQEKKFDIRYDIVPDVLSSEPNSYGTTYNENYTKKRQIIYQGIQETFFNVEKKNAPEFAVIFVADITKGLATKSTLYLNDLKQFLSEALPPDEYYLREFTEIVGDQALVGDKYGRSVDFQEVVWSNFLTEQLKTRIRFKFTQSDFPPKNDPDINVIRIAANTFRLYPFTDYTGFHLTKIRDKKDYTFSREQLMPFEEKAAWEDKERLTTIHFDGKKLLTGNAPEEKK